jgi:dipeptidyl aminopeptidase/acylaminoacyl peptidase
MTRDPIPSRRLVLAISLAFLSLSLVGTPAAQTMAVASSAPAGWSQADNALRDTASKATTRGMVPEDYYRFTFVSDPQISPDGRWVAFVVRTVSEDRRRRQGGIWLVPTDGSAAPRRITSGNSDGSPRWSPDGSRLAFLGTRNGRAQLHVLRLDGGEAEAVTTIRQGSIGELRWHPDGRRLLLSMNLEPTVADPSAAPEESKDPKPNMVHIRHAVYKADGEGYLDERRRHLWTMELPPAQAAPGKKQPDSVLSRVTTGDERWNDRNAVLSPDGRAVAFNRDDSGDEYDGGFEQTIMIVPFAGGEPARLPGQAAGRAESPMWSPDGASIVYRHTPERYARAHLHLIPAAGGEPRILTKDADFGFSNLLWHPSRRHLYSTADHEGARPLFRLAADGTGARVLFGEEGSVSSVTLSGDGGRIAFLYEDETRLPEVWVTDADGRNAMAVTEFNRELLAGLELNRLEEFRFRNSGGSETQGFLLRPVGWQKGRTYPLVLNIKGGPGGMWGRQWFQEFHMLAGAGYAVAFVNYRGSTGYGHAHQAAVRLDYGGADAADNLQAVDEVLARWPWVDRERLYVTGGSHGGFLTNWLTTQTDRFRAAVTQRSVSNWISEAGTQAYPPRSMRQEFGGTIWENFDLYWQRSPLAHATKVSTPTLVIHSDGDRITPLGQGEEWFFALKALGVPTEMVVFQGEGHGLSRTGTPVNLVERLRRIIEWFDRWDAKRLTNSEDAAVRNSSCYGLAPKAAYLRSPARETSQYQDGHCTTVR